MVEETVGIIHKLGVLARLGLVTRPTEVEKNFLEIDHSVVEVEVRVVIGHVFI